MSTHIPRFVVLAPLLAACAAAPAQVAAPPAIAAAPPPVEAAPAAPPIATCASPGADGCFPEEAFKDWLCGGTNSAAAFDLFRKGSPWVRAYVTRNLDSWDPTGHSRAARAHLSLDEEVVVLHPYKPSSGVIVVGATNARGWSSVDAVRLDGTCVSLMADEIAMKRPPAPTHAPLAWERLDDGMRAELLASPDVKKKADRMTKACAASPDKRCTQARLELTDAVVSNAAPSSNARESDVAPALPRAAAARTAGSPRADSTESLAAYRSAPSP